MKYKLSITFRYFIREVWQRTKVGLTVATGIFALIGLPIALIYFLWHTFPAQRQEYCAIYKPGTTESTCFVTTVLLWIFFLVVFGSTGTLIAFWIRDIWRYAVKKAKQDYAN